MFLPMVGRGGGATYRQMGHKVAVALLLLGVTALPCNLSKHNPCLSAASVGDSVSMYLTTNV
jgi:hypothetical protein